MPSSSTASSTPNGSARSPSSASTPQCCPAAPATPEGRQTVTPDTIPTPLILFDGVCNLCCWSVQFLAPRDRNHVLWFAAVQSVTGQAVLKGHGLPASDYESFVLVENGRAYFKSDAFFRAVRYMAWPWPLLRIARHLPHALADWLYDRVARNRYAVFGRKAICMLPRADLAARFLP